MVARTAALILGFAAFGCSSQPHAKPSGPASEAQSRTKPPVERKFARPAFKKTAILVYHDFISKRGKDSLWFDCTTAEFRDQIAAMTKAGVKFVSLAEVEDELFGGKQPDGPQVAITFADNYAGAMFAWPILRRQSIPVTTFVHTDYVGDLHGRPKLPWSRMSELARFPLVTIASESCSHPEDITRLSDADLKHEMVDSAKSLEDHLGLDIQYIAYPNGKYDKRVMEAARAAGYKLGFTESQHPAEAATDPMAVPRYVHTKWKEALHDIGAL